MGRIQTALLGSFTPVSTYVMVGHYAAGILPGGLLQRAVDHKYIAVDLFFVLSGFVLAMAYGNLEEGQAVRGGYRKFIGDRIARIAPLYLVTTAVSYCFIKAGWLHFGVPVHPDRALIPNLLGMQSWVWSSGSLNAPGWSVSTEWAANLIFPILVTAVLLSSRLLASTLAATSFLVLGMLAFLDGGSGAGAHVVGSLNLTPDATPSALMRCLASFILGLATYRLAQNPSALSRVGGNLPAAAATLGILVLLPFWYADVALIALFCLLVVSLYSQSSLVDRILGHGLLHWLGVISFSIYLVHAPLLALDGRLEPLFAHSAHVRPEVLAMKIVIALIVSAISYYSLENPARRALKRLFARKLTQPVYKARAAE